MQGGALTTACDEVAIKSQTYLATNGSSVDGLLSLDWVNVAGEAMIALSLGAGISDGNASNARLWTEFIPTSNKSLDPSLPSTAEALAVMAGGSLLLSSLSSPLNNFDWNYSRPSLEEPQYQSFSAFVKSQQYSSGGNQGWQGIFYIVLILVFATNVFVLVYLCVRRGQVTDFTEPQNLFALSINSPASQRLAGACGGGPEGPQWSVPWFVDVGATDHVFLRNHEDDYADLKQGLHSRNDSSEDVVGQVGMVRLTPERQHQQYSPINNNTTDINDYSGTRTPGSASRRMSTISVSTTTAVAPHPSPSPHLPSSASSRRLTELRDERDAGEGKGSPLMQSFEELSKKTHSIL
jgi:hypothetical protein